jgi:hypothetical protein
VVDRRTLYQAALKIKKETKEQSVTKAEEDEKEGQFKSDRGLRPQ